MELSMIEARRLALAAQGFGRAPPAKPTIADVRRVAAKAVAINVDSINVLVRSHYLVPWSRLGRYSMNALDELTYTRRELFEGHGRGVALMPVDLFPVLRPKMEQRHKVGAWTPKGEHLDRRYIDQVYDELAERGPLAASELSNAGRTAGKWWGWSFGKSALEHLWMSGRVGIAGREGFTRLYDIVERVIPAEVLAAPHPGPEESKKQLLCLAAQALGIAPAMALVDFFGLRYFRELKAPDGKRPKPPWKRLVNELVDEGRLVAAEVERFGKPAYTVPGAVPPRSMAARALISPFDGLMWGPAEVCFDFTQHLAKQLYVPAEKREYGYYVLPFLLGDMLVGRCDLKADRQGSTLLVQSAYIELGHDEKHVAGELADELRAMQHWLELDAIKVETRGDLAPTLRKAVG